MSSEWLSKHAGPGGPEPIKSGSRAIRALAHPVRMKLLQLLGHTGTLTATQAAEVLGESPANCAFHLRTLAKYGFVEEAGRGRGRQRPWRRVHGYVQVAPSEAGSDPESAATTTAIGDLIMPALMDRARDTLARRDAWPAAWQHGTLSQSAYTAYLTLDEARQLRDDLHDLMTRYFDRVDHPARRPANAIPVEFLNFAYPLLDLLDVPPSETTTSDGDQS